MNKICAIHQPNFLPWLGYFYKISVADVFVILDNVDILTGSAKAITNRTMIKTQAGKQWITIPIKNGNSKLIKDIVIVNNNWQVKMLKTITNAYSKSINYNKIYPIIESIINYKTDSLSEFNINAIIQINKILNIATEIKIASNINVNTTDRNLRIVELCKYLNSQIYMSGIGGKKYHNEKTFKDHNISICYSDFKHPIYTQLHGDFIEGISIIDFLFNSINYKI